MLSLQIELRQTTSNWVFSPNKGLKNNVEVKLQVNTELFSNKKLINALNV